MKVLQVNCVYGKGSTGKLVQDLHRGLQEEGIDSVVCYGRGAHIDEPNVYKTCPEWYSKLNNLYSRITGMMYGGCWFSTRKLIRMIRKECPDVVHLQCINGYFVNIYKLVEWLKKQRIKTVLTLHAEFMYTANCGHAQDCEKWKTGCGRCPRFRKETKSCFVDNTPLSYARMKQAFDGFSEDLRVVSVSPWLMGRAKQSPILMDKLHSVIGNGVDTSVFRPYDTDDLRKKHKLGDAKVLFHATPYFSDDPHHLKGGHYILQLAKVLRERNVKILVAGNCKKGLSVPENVILLGNIADQQELAGYYSLADVTVLTSQRETFSMVTAESLCCGTPVVGFRAGGPEQIALEKYSSFTAFGNLSELNNRIFEILERKINPEEIAMAAGQKYAKEVMIRAYADCYRILCGEEKI